MRMPNLGTQRRRLLPVLNWPRRGRNQITASKNGTRGVCADLDNGSPATPSSAAGGNRRRFGFWVPSKECIPARFSIKVRLHHIKSHWA